MAAKPLTSRRLDLLYFCFFLVSPKKLVSDFYIEYIRPKVHVPATLLVDLQALYPSSITPKLIATLPQTYVAMSRDPLIGGAMGYFGKAENYVWFRSFLLLEA